MGSKRRIVFVSSIAAPLQVRFAEALTARGIHDYTFLFCNPSSRDRGSHWHLQLPTSCKVLRPVYFAKQERYLNPSIFGELARLDADLLVFGGLKLPTILLANTWFRTRRRLRCLFSEPPRSGAISHGQALALRLAYGSPHCVLATGRTALKVFGQAFPGALIENIPYPADIATNLAHAERAPGAKVRFLFSGRFVEGNHPLLALQAFALLRARHPGVELVFSGSGPQAAILHAACPPALRAEGAVRFAEGGSWDDVWSEYRKADVLIMPREFCGWGQVIPEAMASGMGIIAGAGMESARDLIEDGVNGFLLDRLDAATVANRMERYVARPELVTEHGRLNKRLAEQQTFEARAAQWDGFFARAFERATTRRTS